MARHQAQRFVQPDVAPQTLQRIGMLSWGAGTSSQILPIDPSFLSQAIDFTVDVLSPLNIFRQEERILST